MAETENRADAAEPNMAAVVLSEPAPAEEARPEPTPTERKPVPKPARSGFGGFVLGGVLAAAAGYGLAQYAPDGWPIADTAALEAQLAQQSAEIADLKDSLAAVDGLTARIAALESTPAADLAPLSAEMAALAQRIARIEELPTDGTGASPAAVSALAETVKALETQVATLQASGPTPAETEASAVEAARKEAEALAAAENATRKAAFSRLQLAMDAGLPYADLLAALGAGLPEVLVAHAETGQPSLAQLQKTFPEPARAAIDAALRADMGDSWTERASRFLRSQTGARSLTPQDGTDPDAILSRAEAALTAGDLPKALAELAALPDVAKAEMATWQAQAEQRLAADKALADLAATLGN